MRYRLSSAAREELDGIWLYVATESGSVEIANGQIDKITDCFWLLVAHPSVGRRRDYDLGAKVRSFPVGEFIVLYRVADRELLILHIFHGSRYIEILFIN